MNGGQAITAVLAVSGTALAIWIMVIGPIPIMLWALAAGLLLAGAWVRWRR